ncbi:MAG: hypothetical protein HZA91_09375 [Verrucomicrobia bacterium]|nr:hypothetical protein [Verrucomicrobiota bacterium]
MKPKTLITLALLVFVAASVATLIMKETRPKPAPATVTPTIRLPHQVVAYYFHGTKRCETCQKIEKVSREALESGFADDLKSGRLERRVVNVDDPAHEHFVKEYGLKTQALVLSELRDGRQTRWVNLEKIWDVVNDQAAFIKYVQDAARAYLEAR